MKERPILFSKPMVCAIREGRKTQTRRVVKFAWTGSADALLKQSRIDPAYKCPYGAPHERLWVRETWQGYRQTSYEHDEWEPMDSPKDRHKNKFSPVYRADGKNFPDRWFPAIHMPREFSRILLEVVSVRVERLNQISREDAIAEGVTSRPNCFGFNGQHDGWSADWSRVGLPSKFATQDNTLCESDISLSSPQLAFQNLWESINGPDSWDANPWVWVVEFKVVHS